MTFETLDIPIKFLKRNTGQIPGVPKNPRIIKDNNFKKLKDSIVQDPEMLELREIIAYKQGDDYIIIGGNMRFEALKALNFEKAKCKVITGETTTDQLKRIILKDNSAYGEWDFDELANEWEDSMINACAIDVPNFPSVEEIEEEKKQEEEEKLVKNLRKEWIVPPMSVFDTRQGEWQSRKTLWRSLVDNKTIGESREATLYKSPEMRYPKLYQETAAERKRLGISFREFLEKYCTEEQLAAEKTFGQGTSLFDPVLAEIVMKWFAPKNGKIIDPFGGEPTKGIVAGVLGYDYTAVEFRQDQVDVNKKACAKFPNVKYFCGDSNNIDKIVNEKDFDLCFTSPPYYDLEVYSKEDMSALGTYKEFMSSYFNIFKKCVEKLKDNAFVVVKVGEIRDRKTSVYRNFVGDNVVCFQALGLHYWNEIILVQPVGTAAMRADNGMAKRKVQHVHQNILVFKKEKSIVEKIHENVLVFYKGNPKKCDFPRLDVYDVEKLIENGKD